MTWVWVGVGLGAFYIVFALIEYVEANEAYVANSFLVFERRADSASLASPHLRFEAARAVLGLTKEAPDA